MSISLHIRNDDPKAAQSAAFRPVFLSPLRKFVAGALVMAAFMAQGTAFAQSNDPTRGLSFIGLNRASDRDVDVVAEEFVRAGGQLNVGFLPYEFSKRGEDPFRKIDRLIRSTAPSSSVKNLNVTIYLRWYDHDKSGRTLADQLYKAFETGKSGTERTLFENRTNEAMRYVKSFRNSRSPGNSKVNFTIVPVLEDECRNRAGYRAINDFVRAAADWAGVSVALRRSHVLYDQDITSPYPFNPALAIPTEVHGASVGWVEQKLGRKLVNGEMYSNDGSIVDTAAFVKDARLVKTRGVHVAYWIQAFNGVRTDSGGNAIPQNERDVRPFTDPATGESNRATLKKILSDIK